MMNRIQIQTSSPYEVLVGQDLLKNTANLLDGITGYSKVAIITDQKVAPLYLQQVSDSFPADVQVFSLVLPQGEATKSAKKWTEVLSFLCQNGLTRTDLVVALGGGVIGDLTGFAASCYLRGVRYLQIPTTLLAQVDSSVGGKTAINIPEGKNLIGSFYQPCRVICDIDTLATLDAVDFSSGMAEVIKYGCIYDADMFDDFSHMDQVDVRMRVIQRCIEIKAIVVTKDERDTGLRMILNFGHTLGHAVEKEHGFSGYTHGQSVAIGMIAITKLSEKSGFTPAGIADQIESICKQFDLPTVCDVSPERLVALCARDKKNTAKALRVLLLDKMGSCQIVSMTMDEFATFVEVSA